MPDKLYNAVLQALRAWHTPEGDSESLLEMLLLVQRQRTEFPMDGSQGALRFVTNRVLLLALETLQQQSERSATILRARFCDEQSAKEVAVMLNLTADSIHRLQRKAVEQLVAILQEQEMTLRQEQRLLLEKWIPPKGYSRLFGCEPIVASLLPKLLSSDPPWVFAISGMGGLGKTAVTDTLTRQLISTFQFKHVLWVRVKSVSMSGAPPTPTQLYQQILAQLAIQLTGDTTTPHKEQTIRHLLKQYPSLIVVDNIESQEAVETLITQLLPFADPSKLLLTTRYRPLNQSGVYTHPLEELNKQDSLALFRYEAGILGLSSIVQADDDQLGSIYQVTGGNPLTLKLVLGLTAVKPIPTILAELTKTGSNDIDPVYEKIYRYVWQTVSPTAHTLLKAMLMFGDAGATPEQLTKITSLSERVLWEAIQELVSHSLFEVRGDAWQKRYTIHRLTETFLQTEIIKWKPTL